MGTGTVVGATPAGEGGPLGRGERHQTVGVSWFLGPDATVGDTATTTTHGGLPMPITGPWLSATEASEYVGVSWPCLKEWLLDRQVPHVKLGRRWKINVDTLDAALKADADAQVGAS